APALGIFYFYSISISLLTQNQEAFLNQQLILQTTALMIITLIAVDTAIIGFFVSKYISKPIKELHVVAQELEKGNFNVRTNIKTHDEIEHLGIAFNDGAVALAKMDEERQQLDRAKSEFLSITSHELRTPITPLKAQLQMLKEGYFGGLNDQQKESLDIVLRCTERLNKLIEDFLEISRIEVARLKFNFRKTDLNLLITNIVSLMQGFALTKNIALEIYAEPLPEIEVDPDRISQVLRNLIHNAIKFSPSKSSIEIHAQPQPNNILFSIKDRGVGMTADDKIRVFEPFFQVEKTLNREHGGSGLGLAICRGIVEAQKGKIWVESTPEKGSTFSFTIPYQPIREIEPIKVLFSPKADIERKLRETFSEVLGPMGLVEYNDLQIKNSLGQQDLYSYIDSLQAVCVLDETSALTFKSNITHIYANRPLNQVEYNLIEICPR
ncbi:MAG: HAMP domain-containing histidine kinase, partial [Candidatus Thermoplasmatota archaeon]|nr:HAMP domain-containing histidine kinase [Candidatus Thermoplasmatota archaeon]